LVDSTLIRLFSELLKISKNISSKSKNIVKEILWNIPFVEIKISKLINYLMDMC